MRTITQTSFGGTDVLEQVDVPSPEPSAGEVRIAVGAIGVNPLDVAVREGWYPMIGEPPFTLGWDVAGTVDALGDGVTDFAVGDRVFGMPRLPGAGNTYAEQVVVPAAELLATPDWLDDAHAAALPLVAHTAYRSIVEIAQLQPGQRVLVQAAGGGVGHVAVQLAKTLGAEVVATASAGKVDFVRGLGADQVIDYREQDFATLLSDVDLVIDPFGGESVGRSLAVVRDGGVVASLLDVREEDVVAAKERGIELNRVRIVPSRAALQAVVDLMAADRLAVHVSGRFPLAQAGAAHDELGRGVVGKLVLVP
ncbi:NADP-dependent oxidoreductase [Aeromicrobium chenweiae]|uniref:NADPH:quinone reductase n=1 Tax=Aeromicrobium chenweiae TaxID=2079793 RepID=A0A2S0WHQ8_9ACTN|nr:NADP-dependent oxidoreductase [Aeromicrobium chenweiae]AWB90858.1 NADPH:quinone reductase [Aeromicrobium chenweiae]TGN32076.1 NADP-dependent oxidoreductase [Aeromicrobium chenweiae]